MPAATPPKAMTTPCVFSPSVFSFALRFHERFFIGGAAGSAMRVAPV